MITQPSAAELEAHQAKKAEVLRNLRTMASVPAER
jgi:hypothetical protein